MTSLPVAVGYLFGGKVLSLNAVYLLGAALGGIALAAAGFAGLGAMFGVLFLLAAVPHAVALRFGGDCT